MQMGEIGLNEIVELGDNWNRTRQAGHELDHSLQGSVLVRFDHLAFKHYFWNYCKATSTRFSVVGTSAIFSDTWFLL